MEGGIEEEASSSDSEAVRARRELRMARKDGHEVLKEE